MIDNEFADPDCPCCAGRTDFNWVLDACDLCASEIVSGSWDEGHPHELSAEQRESINNA